MLDPNALKSVVALSQRLSAEGLFLSPVADTPLALLVHELPTSGIDHEKIGYDELIGHVVDRSRDERHHEIRQTYLNSSVAAVRQTLSFTRGTVMPHVRRVLEAYKAAMDSVAAGRPPIDFKINYLPDIYGTGVGRDLISRWDDVPTAVSPGAVKLGDYEHDEILELVKVTNDEDFNESMASLLQADGGKGLQQIQEVLGGTRNVTQLDHHYTLPASVALSAIETPKEGLGMNLSTFNAHRVSMANVAGKEATRVLGRLGNSVRDTNIYSSLVLNKEGPIELVGEVYRDLLEKGLTVEALMGNEILGRQYRGTALINPDNIKVMMDAYEKDRLLRQQAAAQDRKVNSRKAVMAVLKADLEEMAEKGEFILEDDDKDRAWNRLRTIVDKIMASEWRDVDAIFVIATCLCVTWYAHTDAARFIDIMLDIEKQHPGIPETEFDFLATLQYISLWVASQVEVSRG